MKKRKVGRPRLVDESQPNPLEKMDRQDFLLHAREEIAAEMESAWEMTLFFFSPGEAVSIFPAIADIFVRRKIREILPQYERRV